jgi:hypothetical protein
MKFKDYIMLSVKEKNLYTGEIEYPDGQKCTYLKRRYHSFNDKPAVEWPDGSKEWYFEGKLHRLDGPAIEGLSGFVEYWYDGKQTTKEAIELLNSIMKFREIHECSPKS